MIPVTLFTDDLRIELNEAYVDPWSYRSASNLHELLDVEVPEEDAFQLVTLLGLDEDCDRRMLVASLGYTPALLSPAELRLEPTGRVVLTVSDRESISFLRAFRLPLNIED